jgi:hypothetical protein
MPMFNGINMKFFEKVGIQVHVIKSGELKDSGSVFRQMTPEESDVFQKIVDEYHQNYAWPRLPSRSQRGLIHLFSQ